MSFIDDSIKNVEKSVLKEVTGATSVGGFVGRRGIGIDSLFAGPFNPEYSEIEKLLNQQLEDRKKKIKDTESIEANPVGGWYITDTESNRLAYKELFDRVESIKQFNIENTPILDTEWKSTGVNIDFDDIYTHIDNEDDFINKSETNMKSVGIDIKYDDDPEYAGEDYINKSKTNWEYIGR